VVFGIKKNQKKKKNLKMLKKKGRVRLGKGRSANSRSNKNAMRIFKKKQGKRRRRVKGQEKPGIQPAKDRPYGSTKPPTPKKKKNPQKPTKKKKKKNPTTKKGRGKKRVCRSGRNLNHALRPLRKKKARIE